MYEIHGSWSSKKAVAAVAVKWNVKKNNFQTHFREEQVRLLK